MKELEEVIAYLKDRYDINISTENYIRNKWDRALKNAFSEDAWAGDICGCGQPSCDICHG